MNEIRGSIKCFDRLPVRACGQFWFDQACLGKAPLLGAINIVVFFTNDALNFQEVTLCFSNLSVEISLLITFVRED